jgi:hypothetical protein
MKACGGVEEEVHNFITGTLDIVSGQLQAPSALLQRTEPLNKKLGGL